jgi:hypothetical protein
VFVNGFLLYIEKNKERKSVDMRAWIIAAIVAAVSLIAIMAVAALGFWKIHKAWAEILKSQGGRDQ